MANQVNECVSVCLRKFAFSREDAYAFADNIMQHHLPHIHVEYAETEAVIQIPDGELLEGKLPAKQDKLVQAWVALHADELMADWKLASTGMTPYKIDPLK